MPRRRRRRENSDSRPNPDLSNLDTTPLTEKVAPGFGAYAATRFISRTAYTLAERRNMGSAKHLAAGAAVAAAGAAWLFGDKMKQARPYYEPILIGAGTAAVQSIVQAYFPQWGWIVGDLPKGGAQVAAQPMRRAPTLQDVQASDDFEITPLVLLPGQPPPPGTVTKAQSQAAKEEELIAELADYSEMNDSY